MPCLYPAHAILCLARAFSICLEPDSPLNYLVIVEATVVAAAGPVTIGDQLETRELVWR